MTSVFDDVRLISGDCFSKAKLCLTSKQNFFVVFRLEVLRGACAYAFPDNYFDLIFMKGESQDTQLTFGEKSMSKSQSVEEEFNVKNGGSYVTHNRQTDVIFHSKISDLANFEHPYLVSKNFPRYVVGLVRSAKT